MMKTKAMKKLCTVMLAFALAAGIIAAAGKANTLNAEAASLKTQINKILKSNTKTSDYTVTEKVTQADGTIENVTKPMTTKEKKAQILKDNKANLKSLFKYMEKTYGYARYTKGAPTKKNWQKTFATQMLKNKKGSCYHYAALYAYLAKQATGYNVRIALGKTKGFGNKNQAHAWVEVKIDKTWYICDPNMDQFAANKKLKYCLKKRSSASMKKIYYSYKGAKYITVKKL